MLSEHIIASSSTIIEQDLNACVRKCLRLNALPGRRRPPRPSPAPTAGVIGRSSRPPAPPRWDYSDRSMRKSQLGRRNSSERRPAACVVRGVGTTGLSIFFSKRSKAQSNRLCVVSFREFLLGSRNAIFFTVYVDIISKRAEMSFGARASCCLFSFLY